ncbi:alpha/beta fold hydrolase [Kribbella sp. NPDC051587]|uniref:alpha/beta fold hydrolase n=1 Tax=Kribbella sp. NPDC051587 TaxID=3364119 RepID=UPI003795EA21
MGLFEKAAVRDSGMLPVGGGHEVYWEESGNPNGIPAVYLHGGPGGSLGKGSYRAKFDPDRFRIIGLDQRGCGRSTPHVTTPGYDLGENTTGLLIDDLETLREHLRVERWLVNGVSWGSTLALAYAQAHPQRVSGVVLMAVTTTDRFQVEWITETVGAIYPEAWDRAAGHAEQAGVGYRRGEERLVEAYARLMTDADPAVRDAASLAWMDWEDSHVSIGSGTTTHSGGAWEDAHHRQGFATLVTHYWAHDAFLDPPVLERMERLEGIPATLIHGRRDVSGPAVVAWDVHRGWPGSELIVVEDEGHGGPAMVDAWCRAISRHADRLEREHPR